MIIGEKGVPGGGPFDTLLDDICNALTLTQISGQSAGYYLKRDDVIRLVTRHAQREAASQNLRSVLLLNGLMAKVLKRTTLDSDKLYASSVMQEFLTAIENLKPPEEN